MATAADPKKWQGMSEDLILKRFLIISFAVHAVVFLVHPSDWFRSTPPPLEEWSMDADLIPDINISSPKDTALPKAAPAEEAAVKANLLPQLTKKMAIEEAKPVEDKSAMPDPDFQKPPEQKAEEPKPAAPVTIPKDDPEEQNRLKMEDALKRLALEKLKAQKKEDKETKAPNKEELARLKEAVAKNQNINAGVVGNGENAEHCLAQIHRDVKRNYSLPDAYNLKDAKIMVSIAIVLAENGQLMKAEIKEPSGDSVFDQYAFKAVKDSAPFQPCPEQTGREIILRMKP